MKLLRYGLLGLLAMALLSHCGDRDSSGQVVTGMVDVLEALPVVVGTVEDEASANAAVAKIDALVAEMQELGVRAQKLDVLEASELTRLRRSLLKMEEDLGVELEGVSARPELMAPVTEAVLRYGEALDAVQLSFEHAAAKSDD